jgi:hypothetical protein
MSTLIDLGKAQRRIESALAKNPGMSRRNLNQLVLDVAVSFELPSKAWMILAQWADRIELENPR